MVFNHIGHNYMYNTENIAKMFFKLSEDVTVTTVMTVNESNTVLKAVVSGVCGEKESEFTVNNSVHDYEHICKFQIAVCVYNACCDYTGKELPFGYLCGVRPAKIATDMLLNGGTSEEAYNHYVNDLKLRKDKASSCVNVAESQLDILKKNYDDRCNIYVSIPFCPSRCNYCSFVSHTIERAGKLLSPYVMLLTDEIKRTAALIKELDLKCDSVYIGGGTPGILDEEQTELICSLISSEFASKDLAEFTYEFGRADVASKAKFDILRKYGVSRVCINPQILSDEVLKANGRRHSVQQFYNAFKLARNCGFDNINCDIIAGLPYSTKEVFCETVEKLVDMNADDITMHTLALKRSSAYFHELDVDDCLAEESFDAADEILHNAGYKEYYMYRQKRAGGNLENKGYALEGKKSIYNILMMSDASTVISTGAGGITKLVAKNGQLIERVCNYKYPYEYIDNPKKIEDNHSYIREFYKKNS